jgi:hypothetical protein
MQVPTPCGPLSEVVITGLRDGRASSHVDAFADKVTDVTDPLADADLQLALACCYELHYRGFDGVDDAVEWDPGTMALTRLLERAIEAAVLRAVPRPPAAADVVGDLGLLVEKDDAPSLSAHLLRRADVEQWREFLVQRSVYHLKEADPHTWQVPRITGRAKAALVEIQMDEYGGGRPDGMHSALFARAMRELGLDDSYGAYWPQALPETHAMVNLMTLFGLHRRHRGAALGHLAALEMTSTSPNRRYGNGLRRLGFGPAATAYFDEHVEADAVHEQIAAVDMCGSFAADEPHLVADVLWGAASCLALDAAAGAALLRRWNAQDEAGAA